MAIRFIFTQILYTFSYVFSQCFQTYFAALPTFLSSRIIPLPRFASPRLPWGSQQSLACLFPTLASTIRAFPIHLFPWVIPFWSHLFVVLVSWWFYRRILNWSLHIVSKSVLHILRFLFSSCHLSLNLFLRSLVVLRAHEALFGLFAYLFYLLTSALWSNTMLYAS